MKKLHRITAAAAALLLCCTGCSMEVESFLRPPRAQGEQKAVQAALETYIKDSGISTKRYALQYPTEGDYTSAFITCDDTGMPVTDGGTPRLAVAFYKPDPAADDIHINLLRRENSDWISVGDTAGFGPNILQVAFGDLDGDGTAELITGWDTYNSQDHRLAVMTVRDGLPVRSDDQVYTYMHWGDITGDDRADLLLLRIGAAATATLETMIGGKLVALDTAPLDKQILQITALTLCILPDGSRGLFADGLKSSGDMVTELIRYDGQRLSTPFSNKKSGINTVTARSSGIAARDVDGDGVPEIPQCRLLPGYDSATGKVPDYGWLTAWKGWDPVTGEWSDRLITVLNTDDGYLVIPDEARRDSLTTQYNPDTRTLSLLDAAKGEAWLRLRVAGESRSDGFRALYAPGADYPGCEAWFDPVWTDLETVQYMVSRLNG